MLALPGSLTWALRPSDVAAAATLFSVFDPSVYIALWSEKGQLCIALFIYLEFYVTFNTVQVILRWVVGRAEETST